MPDPLLVGWFHHMILHDHAYQYPWLLVYSLVLLSIEPVHHCMDFATTLSSTGGCPLFGL